jgi:hypothetical protein
MPFSSLGQIAIPVGALVSLGAAVFVLRLWLVELPVDYLLDRAPSPPKPSRVLLGIGLILAGTFMLVLPGPGLLTLMAGFSLLGTDVPRKALRFMVQRKGLAAIVAQVRARAGRSELLVAPPEPPRPPARA